MDIAATSHDIAGASTSGKNKLDGINLLPLLSGSAEELPSRNLYWRVGSKHAIRKGDWKILRDNNDWELYNLAKDAGEDNNLASTEPTLVKELSSLWDRWNAEQSDPLWK
jgi:arylsulfatase A-like enzyme